MSQVECRNLSSTETSITNFADLCNQLSIHPFILCRYFHQDLKTRFVYSSRTKTLISSNKTVAQTNLQISFDKFVNLFFRCSKCKSLSMQRVGTPDKNLVLFCSCSPQHITGISSKFHPIVPFLLPLHENKKIAKKQEKEEETNKETNKEKEKETKKETKKEKEAVAFFRVLQLSQSLSDCQILYMFTSVYVFRQPHVIHLENVKMFASYLKAFPTVDKIACFSILLTKYSQQEILSFFISLFQHNILLESSFRSWCQVETHPAVSQALTLFLLRLSDSDTETTEA